MSSSNGNEQRVTGVGRSDPTLACGARVDPERTVTPRQLELLALYASGFSYDDIGRMKFFSHHTVKNYLSRAVAHSGARNLTHLCTALVAAGMIRQNAEGVYEPVQDLRLP